MHALKRYLVGALLGLVVTAPASFAQEALILDHTFVSASRDLGQVIGPAPAELRYPLAGGGRYAVGPTAAVDLRTGQSRPLPGASVVLAVDPARPRAFLAWNCSHSADTCDVVA